MYSLWKEVSDQLKKKAEDLNNTIQEFSISGLGKESKKESTENNINDPTGDNRTLPSVIFNTTINDKLNLINKKILNKDLSELQYYNDKFKSGISNIKKIVGDIYNENIKNGNGEDGSKKKIYLSKMVPWKKADIMISKIYRKKFDEGFPLKIPNSHLNKEVYEKMLELNVDRNKILHTDILENYNFVWSKKKEQSEQILEEDANLLKTKNFLVPTYMTEAHFWKSYFFNIDIIYNEIADEIYENREYIVESYKAEQLGINTPGSNSLNTTNRDYQQNTNVFEQNESMKLEEGGRDMNIVMGLGMGTNPNVAETGISTHMDKSNVFDECILKANKERIEGIDFRKEKQHNPYDSLYVEKKDHLLTFDFDDNITSVDVPEKLDFQKIENEKVETENKNDPLLENESSFPSLIKNDDTKHEEAASSVQMAKINGLNIYMDNDIYRDLTEKAGALSELLNNSKGTNPKEILSSKNIMEPDNAFNASRNNDEAIICNGNTNDDELMSFNNYTVSPKNFSKTDTNLFEANSKLLNEIEESNRIYSMNEKKKDNLMEFGNCAEEINYGVMKSTNEKREERIGEEKNPIIKSSTTDNGDEVILLMKREQENWEKQNYEKGKSEKGKSEKESEIICNTGNFYGSLEQDTRNSYDDFDTDWNISKKENEINLENKEPFEVHIQNKFITQKGNHINQIPIKEENIHPTEVSKTDNSFTSFENIDRIEKNISINGGIDECQNKLFITENEWNEHVDAVTEEITKRTDNCVAEVGSSNLEKEENAVSSLQSSKVAENDNVLDDKSKNKEQKKKEADLISFNDEINLEELNFGDDINFDMDLNSFNEEELNQFETYILNT